MIPPIPVLLIWPVIAIAIMGARGMASGVIWSTLIGYMFLPDNLNVNLPGLPPYSKYTAIALGLVLAMAFFAKRSQESKPIHTDGLANAVFLSFVILLLASPVGTFLDNRGSLLTGGHFRSGLTFRDVISTVSEMLIVIVPYYVGRRFIATSEQHGRLLAPLWP